MALISLVYVSLAMQDMPDAELQELLRIARERNAAKDISGMLLYRDGYFIQALEGEDAVVDPLFDKIRLDPRHTSVLVVMRSAIVERAFEQWSMGFNKIEAQQMQGFTDFLDKPFEHSYFEAHPSRAVALLEQFRDRTYF